MKRIVACFILLIFLALPCFAQLRAVVQEMKGKVELKGPAPGARWKLARVGLEISEGTHISTGFGATAVLDLGRSTLFVRQLTRMQLEELVEREQTVETKLYLQVGKIRATVRTGEKIVIDFKVRSPIVTCAVRGTDIEFDGITLKTNAGSAKIINQVGQRRTVSKGEQSSAPGYFTPTSVLVYKEATFTVSVDTSKQAGVEEETGTGIAAAFEGAAPLIPIEPATTTPSVTVTLLWP